MSRSEGTIKHTFLDPGEEIRRRFGGVGAEFYVGDVEVYDVDWQTSNAHHRFLCSFPQTDQGTTIFGDELDTGESITCGVWVGNQDGVADLVYCLVIPSMAEVAFLDPFFRLCSGVIAYPAVNAELEAVQHEFKDLAVLAQDQDD